MTAHYNLHDERTVCTTVEDKDSSLVQVEVGSVLRLDCPVSQLVGGQRAGVMLWKKGHRVLTAGTIKVGPLTGQ